MPVDVRVSLLRCEHCKEPALVSQSDWDQNGAWDQDPAQLWPAAERQLSAAVPHRLRNVHAEARRCFGVQAYTAASVMVRRTLEGLCEDHGVEARSLVEGLRALAAKGLVEGRFLEWAQELRVLGNNAAHFTGGMISREDAGDALDLAEALLDYIYVFSDRFEKFKARRAATSGTRAR
jgi:hypothetical protein